MIDLKMLNIWPREVLDRKSTRLNSSHLVISYAVFCLKKLINCFGMRFSSLFSTIGSIVGTLLPMLLIILLGLTWIFKGHPLEINFSARSFFSSAQSGN